MQSQVVSTLEPVDAFVMARIRRRGSSKFLLLILAAGLLVTPAFAQAADTPLDAIPDNASLLIRLKSHEATVGKVANFVDQVQPGMGDLVKAQANAIGLLISNPVLAGVDQTKDWWIAVFASGAAEPTLVLGIPASDADAMQEAVGGEFQFVTHDEWVLYTQDEATAQAIKARLGGKGKSIASLIDKKSRSVFDSGDLSAYANVTQITTTYQAQLDMAAGQVDALLEQISEAAPQAPGIDLGPIFDMYGQLAKGLLQGVKDTQGFTLAVAIHPQSITIDEYIKVAADSQTDKYLSLHQPSELGLLQKLPAKQLGYFGIHGNTESMINWGVELAISMFEGTDDEKVKGLRDSVKKFKQIKFGSYAGSFNLGNLEDGALQASVIGEVTPADKMKELNRQMTKAMGAFEFGGIKQEYHLQPDAEKFGKYSADLLIVKQEVDENLDALGMQKRMLEAMYGPDGMTSRIVYSRSMFIQAVGSSKQIMTDLLAAVDGAGKSAQISAVKSVRQELIPKVNLIGLIDLPGLVHKVVSLLAASGQVPIPLPPDAIDALKVEPSYLGFAVAAEPQALHCKTAIPIQQIQGIFKLVMFAQSTRQQQF